MITNETSNELIFEMFADMETHVVASEEVPFNTLEEVIEDINVGMVGGIIHGYFMAKGYGYDFFMEHAPDNTKELHELLDQYLARKAEQGED